MKKLTLCLLTVFVGILLTGCRWNKDKETNESNNGINSDQITNKTISATTSIGNDVSSYKVSTQNRKNIPGENIYVYDEDDNLVLSLTDENQPYYLFALYNNYIILDSGTSASQREMIVYNISNEKEIYKTDYYPGDNGIALTNNVIDFYKKIDEASYEEYILPNCDNENDNGYIEKYGYTIGHDHADDIGDIQCAYFE